MTQQQAEQPAILVTSKEAARMLSFSERTLWSLTAPRGPVPCVRVGRSVRYAVADLHAFVSDQTESPAEEAA